MDKKHALIFSLIITTLMASNYYLLKSPQFSNSEKSILTRIIDGDTIEISDGRTIRLININTPEKSDPFYKEAKSFLQQYQNQSITLQITGKDKYNRELARVYFLESYLNLELVKQGLATKFLVDEKEKKVFYNAEEQAIENQKNLWNKSLYSFCISTKIHPKEEIVSIKNSCPDLNLKNWRITDESRKKFIFPEMSFSQINLHSSMGNNTEKDIFWQSTVNVWNNDKDSLYLFDENDKLIHHETYGYG